MSDNISEFIKNNRLTTISIIFYIIRVILFIFATQHKKKDSKDTTIQSQTIAIGSFELMIMAIILHSTFGYTELYFEKFNPLFILILIVILYAIRAGIFTYIYIYIYPNCNDTTKYNTAELKTACETDNNNDNSLRTATITAAVLEAIVVIAILRFMYLNSKPNFTLKMKV